MRSTRGAIVLVLALLAGGLLPGCSDFGADKGPTNPSAQDAIDLAAVTFLDPSPAAFPVTAEAALAAVDRNGMCWHQVRPVSGWPRSGNTDGNAWVFGKVNGRWYGATIDWLEPGRADQCYSFLHQHKGAPPFQTARFPLSEWSPVPGERFGFMISSIVRGGVAPGVQGRSTVTLATWP